MSPERLAELRNIAEAATPGLWEVGEWGDGSNTPGCSNVHAPDSEIVLVTDIPHCDAAHIAAFNPHTALELLEEIDYWQKDSAAAWDTCLELELQLSDAREVIGVMEEALDLIKVKAPWCQCMDAPAIASNALGSTREKRSRVMG